MKNLNELGVQEMGTKEMKKANGGSLVERGEDYNLVLGIVLWPFYDIGYALGRL